jgi:hypothetical protein
MKFLRQSLSQRAQAPGSSETRAMITMEIEEILQRTPHGGSTAYWLGKRSESDAVRVQGDSDLRTQGCVSSGLHFPAAQITTSYDWTESAIAGSCFLGDLSLGCYAPRVQEKMMGDRHCDDPLQSHI